jgi:hypothetical protein
MTAGRQDGTKGPQGDLHTAVEATPRQLLWDSVRLGLMFLVLALLVVPLIREIPAGQTTRTGLLAWLLVFLSFYWLFRGLGFQPLLILQLFVFSVAAVLLTTKAGLVLLGVERLGILRRTARLLIQVGAGIGALNLVLMLAALVKKKRAKRRVGA